LFWYSISSDDFGASAWGKTQEKLINFASSILDFGSEIVTRESKESNPKYDRLRSVFHAKPEKLFMKGDSIKMEILLSVKTSKTKGVYVLSLPGDKRRLGEKSLDCALRALSEEAKLNLNEQRNADFISCGGANAIWIFKLE